MLIRIIVAFLTLTLPVIIGWWVFPFLALFFVYLSKNPIEIVFIGVVINSLYYFGNNIVFANWIFIFSLALYLLDYLISDRVIWKKLL